jgi:hypothetical protein
MRRRRKPKYAVYSFRGNLVYDARERALVEFVYCGLVHRSTLMRHERWVSRNVLLDELDDLIPERYLCCR